MSELLNKLSIYFIGRNAAKRYDDFIFEQFEKHGFSRDYVGQAIKDDRVRIVKHDDYEDFSIDGVFYFSIFKKYTHNEILIHAIDLKGVKK